MKKHVSIRSFLAFVLLLVVPAMALMAETVKVNVILNGKTRSPKTNLWMGVLEVQIADKKSFYTVEAAKAGQAITFDVPEGAFFGLRGNAKLHGYKLNRIEQHPNGWNVVYDADAESEYQYVWFHNDKEPFRIPSIVTMKNGSLLAINDARPCGNDIGYGRVDILSRTSHDNGSTWGAPQAVLTGTGSGPETGYGDACLVADKQREELLLVCVSGDVSYWQSRVEHSQRLVSTRAKWNKKQQKWEWEKPLDHTAHIYHNLFGVRINGLFMGSGRICQSSQVKVGKYYRLYGALCTHKGNFVLYSGTLTRIPKELEEAGQLEGITAWQELIHVVVPLVWPTISTIWLMGLMGFFGASGEILLLTGGAYKTNTLSYYLFTRVYNVPETSNLYNYSSALGIIMTLLTLPVVFIVQRLLEKVPPAEF